MLLETLYSGSTSNPPPAENKRCA